VPAPRDNQDRPGWLGYSAAIAASALLHAGIVVFALFVMPNLLHSETAPPPTYTVKIVDNIPAGDLGTHLPKLSGHRKPPPQQMAKAEIPKPEEPKVEAPKTPPPPPPANEDKNAVALKTAAATPTPTPTPEPPPAAAPTPAPTPTPQKVAKPRPTPKPPQARPTHPKHEQVHKNSNGKKEPVVVAKAENKPNIQDQLRKIREQLMKEHLAQQKKESAEDEDEGDDESEEGARPGTSSGGGPVVGSANTEGKGYGIGPGTGSAGELQDLQFLLYYRQVQQKIKDAWIFPGGSNDLTATVDFSIGPDGNLTGVKIGQSSGDPAFDDSVVRAIRKAAPFPPPPDKYRSEFQSGVAAMFRLGELKSST
jgi:TonB family protein